MMRSLTSAVGGLRSHQTKMDVIGNNIANVNTYGFKSSRATFSDVYYQNIANASAPGTTTGGTNPTQIGYGASVATVDVLNTQSGMASTDRALDIYINGDGMIATKDANGNLRYSRLGILGFDAAGNLVDSSGNFVMGFPINASTGQPIVNPDGSCDPEDLVNIKCKPEMLDALTGISIGTNGDIIGVMPGNTEISINKGKPNWLTDVIIPTGSNLVGDIGVTMSLDQAVSIGGQMNSNWVYNIEAADGGIIDGEYKFEFNRTTQTITATSTVTGKTYSGQYKKGAVVEMKADDGANKGQVGFKITTDATLVPGTGTGMEIMGNQVYENRTVITVNATDAGGSKLTATWDGYNIAAPGKVQNTFNLGDAGSVTLAIDPAEVSKEYVARLAYDASNPFNSWLTNVEYQGVETMNGQNLDIEIANVQKSTNVIRSSGPAALNFLDPAQLDNYINTLGLANGSYGIKVQATGVSDEYTIEIVNAAGASLGTPVVSAPFVQGSGADISFAGVTVGKAPAANLSPLITPPATDFTHNNIITIETQKVIRAFSGGSQVGTDIVFDGVKQPVIIDADGNQVKFTVNAANLNTAFTALGVPGSALQTVGTMARKEINDWPYNGNVGSAKVGDGEKVLIGNIALAKVPNMAAMQQDGTSYFVTTVNSGEASFMKPGLNGTGTIKAGNLEMSNVDISKEFTDMITTQRGFQANTRIITVSDEMLQELVNLKR